MVLIVSVTEVGSNDDMKRRDINRIRARHWSWFDAGKSGNCPGSRTKGNRRAIASGRSCSQTIQWWLVRKYIDAFNKGDAAVDGDDFRCPGVDP